MTDERDTPPVEDAESPVKDGVAAPSATQTLPEERPRGIYLTPKRILVIVAIILAIVLIILLIMLLRLQPDAGIRVDVDPVKGIKAELVIPGPGRGEKPAFSRPMGVCWSPDGDEIFVADTENNRICVFDEDGRFLREFGGFGIAKPLEGAQSTWDPGELNYPTDVATDDEGNVYVADFYNDSISVFTPRGEFVRRFPEPDSVVGRGGSGQGGTGIAVTALTVYEDRVWATDSYQIVVFTKEGELVDQFGMPGSKPGQFDRPNGIAFGAMDRLVVSDSNNNRVVGLTPTGNPIWETGAKLSVEATQAAEMQFILPRGVSAFEDNLLVVDPLAQQLIEITTAGEMLAAYGQRGSAPGEFNFPNDLDVQGQRIVIADRENQRVQVVRIVTQ
jgi:DNA-binding beta-propeller fold protein YncE